MTESEELAQAKQDVIDLREALSWHIGPTEFSRRYVCRCQDSQVCDHHWLLRRVFHY